MSNQPESGPQKIESSIIKAILEDARQAIKDDNVEDFTRSIKDAQDQLRASNLSSEEIEKTRRQIESLQSAFYALYPNQEKILEKNVEDGSEENEKIDQEIIDKEIMSSSKEVLDDLKKRLKDPNFDPKNEYRDGLNTLEFLQIKIEQLELILKKAAQDPYKLHEVALKRKNLLQPVKELLEDLKERAKNLKLNEIQNQPELTKLRDAINQLEAAGIDGKAGISAEEEKLEKALQEAKTFISGQDKIGDNAKQIISNEYIEPAERLLKRAQESENFRKNIQDLDDLISQVVDADGNIQPGFQNLPKRELRILKTSIGTEQKKISNLLEQIDEDYVNEYMSRLNLALDKIETRLNPELEEMSGQELYRYGLDLLATINADMKPYTIDEREDLRQLWTNKFIPELESRDKIAVTINGQEFSDTGERMARYFKHRLKFDAMVNFASTSSYTINPESVVEGWGGPYGAKAASFFNEKTVIELLYGQDFRKEDMVSFEENEDVLRSESSLEQMRIQSIDKILEIACTLFDEEEIPQRTEDGEIMRTEDGQIKMKENDFHATQKFEDARKSDFEAEVKRRFKKYLASKNWLASDGELTPEQKADFGLGINMMIFLDLRTYYMLPHYLGGTSPVDALRDTIGHAAKTYLNGKGMYYICGKGVQMVNPALLVSRYSDKVADSIKSKNKKNNYNFSTKVATPAWDNWYAPSLDMGAESENERVSFKRKNGSLMVPSLSALWLPHGEGKQQANSGLESDTRDAILSVAGRKGPKRGVALLDLLQGAEFVAKFVEQCEAGFTPSGDMKRDAEELIGRATTDIARSISPTKSLPTANTRYLANNFYLFARTSLLAFSREYGQNLDTEKRGPDGLTDFRRYREAFYTFLENLISSLRTAPTTSIKVRNIPKEFRERFSLPTEGDITIAQYVAALLPTTEQNFLLKQKKLTSSRRVSKKDARLIVESVQADRIREKHNNHLLNELADQRDPLKIRLKERIDLAFYGGGPAKLLKDNDFERLDDGITEDESDFYRAMEIIPLTKKDKQAEEKS